MNWPWAIIIIVAIIVGGHVLVELAKEMGRRNQ